jgi:hypothetical protein
MPDINPHPLKGLKSLSDLGRVQPWGYEEFADSLFGLALWFFVWGRFGRFRFLVHYCRSYRFSPLGD